MANSPTDDGAPLLLFSRRHSLADRQRSAFMPGAAALCLRRDLPCLRPRMGGAAEAMHYRHNWPTRGRPPCMSLTASRCGHRACARLKRIAKRYAG